MNLPPQVVNISDFKEYFEELHRHAFIENIEINFTLGWGKKGNKGKYSDDLLEASVTVMNPEECRTIYDKEKM